MVITQGGRDRGRGREGGAEVLEGMTGEEVFNGQVFQVAVGVWMGGQTSSGGGNCGSGLDSRYLSKYQVLCQKGNIITQTCLSYSMDKFECLDTRVAT